jgi:hypothetical protein
MNFMGLREWGGNILINKLAFALDQRQLHRSKHYISAEGCRRTCHKWYVLGNEFSCPLVFWALHCAVTVVIIQCPRVKGHV